MKSEFELSPVSFLLLLIVYWFSKVSCFNLTLKIYSNLKNGFKIIYKNEYTKEYRISHPNPNQNINNKFALYRGCASWLTSSMKNAVNR